MRFRKLRIAWSVVWSVLALLLIALWVRSYYIQDCFRGYPPNSWKYNVMEIASQRGLLGGYFCEGYGPRNPMLISLPIDDDNGWYQWLSSEFGFDISETKQLIPPRGIAFVFPHWVAVLISITLATAAWIRWHFSLRTFLIAMTLFAAILGLIVWSTHVARAIV
jgi:hypothetical protein